MVTGTLFLIHGIGDQKPGYSKEWQENILYYLKPNKINFVEIFWQDVFKKNHITSKTPLQTKLYNTLFDILTRKAINEKIGPIEFLKEVILDFVLYLTNRNLQKDIKDCLKKPLLQNNIKKPLSIIAHSWGSVITYDALFDFLKEENDFSIDTLFTFGSPLWLLKQMDNILSLFHYSGAKKLNNIERWINAYAKEDPIGASLRSFNVDQDSLIPSPSGVPPHLSYFVKENRDVLKDIIADALTYRLT
jgi:hypothetical protein